MTRAERLVFCKQCKNRHLDFNKGLLCNLTSKEADFEGECSDYFYDSSSNYIPKPKEAIRPNGQRAKWAEYILWGLLGLSFLSLISSYLQYDLLLKVEEGFYVSDNELTLNDIREGIVGITNIILYITSVIFFIRWFRRAYYNLNSRSGTSHDEGWAAGSWFVPFLNLYRPVQIMNEIDEGNSALITRYSHESSKKNSFLIGSWWALWILGGIIGRYIFKTSMRANTLNELIQSTQADMFGQLIDIPLTILAILVIRVVSKKETLLAKLEIQNEENSKLEESN